MQDQLSMVQRQAAGAWRNRWFGLAFAWVVCIAGWITISLLPNVYESTARLYVDADAVLTPLLRGLALDNTAAGQLEVMQRTLLSRPNLDMVISRTPLELHVKTPAEREAMINGLAVGIKLVPQTKNLFTLSYQNNSPQIAYDVVQAIMNIFIESRSGTNRADMENARVFLQQQLSSYEQQLRAAERNRAEFRAKYLDLLPTDGGQSHLDTARTAVATLNGALEDALAKHALVARELAGTAQTVVTETSSGGGGGSGDLAAAQARLRDLLLTDTKDHPDVQQAQQRIAMLRGSGAGQGGGAHTASQPNPVYAQLKIELVENEATISSLRRQVADALASRDRLEKIAHDAPGVEAQYVNLDRDYDTLRTNYAELLARRESMRLSSAADDEADKIKLRIVDPAQVPRNPVSPPRVLLTLAVLASGLAAGIVIAVGLAQLDRSFQDLHDLEALGLPVLGGISVIPGMGRDLRRAFAANMALAGAVLLLCGVCGSLIYHLLSAASAA